jgi:alpha-tubulin suppressor-like RCC1 family protein
MFHDHLTPRKPELDGRPLTGVKCMGAGSYHLLISVVVDGTDRMYTTGLNSYGQLGIGSIYNRETFARVDALDGIALSAVKGGVHHSLALSSDGMVWAWGRGDSGQLGISKEPKLGYCEEKPVRVDTLTGTVLMLYAGCTHAVRMLYACCTHAVRMLYSCCTQAVLILCYTHAALMLHSYCTVLMLYSSWH